MCFCAPRNKTFRVKYLIFNAYCLSVLIFYSIALGVQPFHVPKLKLLHANAVLLQKSSFKSKVLSVFRYGVARMA